MLAKLTATLGGAGAIALVGLTVIGSIYWIWMAIMLKSFAMFILGFSGPFALLTGPIGAYSMLFGMPKWLLAVFG